LHIRQPPLACGRKPDWHVHDDHFRIDSDQDDLFNVAAEVSPFESSILEKDDDPSPLPHVRTGDTHSMNLSMHLTQLQLAREASSHRPHQS
jgi:hypothetical protein